MKCSIGPIPSFTVVSTVKDDATATDITWAKFNSTTGKLSGSVGEYIN